VAAAIGAVIGMSACDAGVPDLREATAGEIAIAEVAEASEHIPTHIDSIFPIEESLRRFRLTLGPEPERLSGGASSRDALVGRFVRALAASDTAAFADMLLTRDEFAWLYYPHTRYTERPYELAPEILWLQIENASSRGFGRLLDRLGSTDIGGPTYQCRAAPLVEGPNRVWEECTVRVDPPEGDPRDMGLFGSILERDGVFKFVSYTNDY
jgi:hypothetical protein